MRFNCGYVILAMLSATTSLRGDAFDNYTNPILGKVPQAKGVEDLKQLTAPQLIDNDQVLTNASAAFLVVRTNENRWSKLLVQSARRKLDADNSVPILLIERYVTFKEGEETTVQAAGKNVNLFNGFRINLDIGQVVPADFAADLRFVAEEGKIFVEPIGKAKLYLLTKAMPEASPKKTGKVVVGETFESRYFTGSYRLYDDGRRSGILKIEVDSDGLVTGHLYSDKDGAKYEVTGRIGKDKHAIHFTVKLPRIEQVFQGWMFTGDGKAITGFSRFQTRETGFYAIRVEQ